MNNPLKKEMLPLLVERYIEEADEAEDKELSYEEKLALRLFAQHPERVYDFMLYMTLGEDEIAEWSAPIRNKLESKIKQVFTMFGVSTKLPL